METDNRKSPGAGKGLSEYTHIYTAYGQLAGEMIRLLLEAQSIPVILLQESAGTVYGLTVGPLGEVRILVPTNRVRESLEILQAMEEGKLGSALNDYAQSNQYKENKQPRDERFTKDDDLS